MTHLLYASNEMFSSTQLIRKSKDIFDKLSSNEIDKAIILRDGKPNFMLLDFNKYEQIMKEYIALKNQVSNNIQTTIQKNTAPIKEERISIEENIDKETISTITPDIPTDLDENSEHSKAQIKEFWN